METFSEDSDRNTPRKMNSLSDFKSSEGGLVLERVNHALQLARLAVDEDSKGNYEPAAVHYKETITILETSVISAPEEHQQQMFDLAKQYRQRVELLESVLPCSEETPQAKPTSELPIHFWLGGEEAADAPLPDPPPTIEVYRPFWLMKVLATIIQHGGHLTPKIYVPKNIWYQPGVKFAAIYTKAASCLAINEGLLKLKDINVTNKYLVLKELETFCTQLTHIQNSLAKALYYIPEYKEKDEKRKEKRFGNAIKKMGVVVARGVGKMKGRDKLDDVGSYLLVILDVLQNGQFLESWLQESEPTSLVALRLRRVADFFLVVICEFVVRDLKELLERYIRKAKKEFTKMPIHEKREKKAKAQEKQLQHA